VVNIVVGLVIWIVLGGIFELLFSRVLGVLPESSGYPIVLAALVVLLLYKFWYRPQFEGALRGGRPELGLKLWIPILISWLTMPLVFMLTPAQFGWPTFITIGTSLAAGFSEEAIFRSFGLSTIMRKVKNERDIIIGLVLTAVIFGVVHGFNIFSGANSGHTVLQIISAGFLGLFFGALYLRCGNLWPCILVHAVNDIIALTDVSNVTEVGIVVGSVSWLNYLDIVMCLIIGIIGLWMIRAEKRPEIMEIWSKKWKTDPAPEMQ